MEKVTKEENLSSTMNANAILVAIEIHKLGLRRRVKAQRASIDDTQVGDNEGQIATKRVGVSKKILDIEESKAISKIDSEFYQDVMDRVLPSNYRRGIYLLPVKLIDWFEQRWVRYGVDREFAVEKLILAYNDGIEASKTALGPLFDPGDYPSEEEVRDAYWVERTYQQVSAPEALSRFSPSLYEQSKDQLREQMEKLAEEARVEMRVGLLELTKHLKDALTPGEDGKQKKLFDSTVQKFKLWLSLFDSRNITGDKELSGVVDQLKAVMGEDVDRKTIRKDEALREKLLESMSEAAVGLEKLVEEKPAGLVGGSLSFDD